VITNVAPHKAAAAASADNESMRIMIVPLGKTPNELAAICRTLV
jgi:hypothetical protein